MSELSPTNTPRPGSLLFPVVQHVTENGWTNVRYYPEFERLVAPLSGNHGRYITTVHANNESGLLSVTTAAPVKIPEDRRRDVAELLCRLNWNSWVGCLEMDFSDGEVVCRTEVDFEGGVPTPTMVSNLIGASMWRLDRSTPTVMAVAFGNRTPEQAIADAHAEAARAEGGQADDNEKVVN